MSARQSPRARWRGETPVGPGPSAVLRSVLDSALTCLVFLIYFQLIGRTPPLPWMAATLALAIGARLLARAGATRESSRRWRRTVWVWPGSRRYWRRRH